MSNIKYKLITGQLPTGFDLGNKYDVLALQGVVGCDEITLQPPYFETESDLGAYGERTNLNIPIKVYPRGDKQLTGVFVYTGNLPWGLTLDSITHSIVGRANELLDRDAPYYSESESPKWITDEGQLGIFDEEDLINLRLQTDRQNCKYFIRSGYLPFGSTLTTNGSISGRAYILYDPNVPEVKKEPKPLWNTAMGSLGVYQEGQTISVNISATAQLGTTCLYSIVNGALPFGFILSNNGSITGKAAELYAVLDDSRQIPSPEWVTLQGGVAILNEKQAANITLHAIPNEGTILKYYIVNGALPFGLILNSNGTITGNTYELYRAAENDTPTNFEPVINNSNNLGDYKVGDSVNINLNASTPIDRTIESFQIVDSFLPFGLMLGKTGKITGSLSAMNVSTIQYFTICVTDSAGVKSYKTFNMGVIKNDYI